VEKRTVAAVGLFAGGGVLAWWLSQQQDGGGVYAPIDLSAVLTPDFPVAGPPDGSSGTNAYLDSLSAAEDPSGDPYAKNPEPGQTASGLFQFTKGTWTSLGGDWGDDPTKAFGGLTPSVAEQYAMAAKLTAGNASILDNIGVDVSNATLYATHILGGTTAVKTLPSILASDPATPLTTFLPSHTVAVNPALGKTVGSFLSYVTSKVG
jgi:hypothetical protein